jgi:hypothetical protein
MVLRKLMNPVHTSTSMKLYQLSFPSNTASCHGTQTGLGLHFSQLLKAECKMRRKYFHLLENSTAVKEK